MLLFQLVTLSQYHLQQLLSTNDLGLEDDSMTLTLAIYKPRQRLLCEVYDHYLSGFADAVILLQKLQDGAEGRFRDFVTLRDDEEEEDQGMSIEQFIQMPLKVN